MLRCLVALILCCIYCGDVFSLPKSVSFKKLKNNISLIFIDDHPDSKNDSILIVMSVASGNIDEFDKEGVANLLAKIFDSKMLLRDNVGKFHVSNDQSIFYGNCKQESVKDVIKKFSTIVNFSFSIDDINKNKYEIEQMIVAFNQKDSNIARQESKRSLYWHSKYGAPIMGSMEDLKNITQDDLINFRFLNYSPDKITFIIAGKYANHKEIEDWISSFFQSNSISMKKIDRLQEPPHHGASVIISQYSHKRNTPLIDLYWKIPNYRTDKNKALATEIFINHLDDVLQKTLVEEQKIATSITFTYSFWNYDYGDFCISVDLKNNANTKEAMSAIVAEIKYIVSDEISKSQADKALEKIISSTKLDDKGCDYITDWIIKKLGSGCDWNFIKEYQSFVKTYDLNLVNQQAKTIFKNDPCVISVIESIKRNHVIQAPIAISTPTA